MIDIPGSQILDALQDMRTALTRLSGVEDTLKKVDQALVRIDERLRILEADVRVAEIKAVQAATSAASQEARDLMGHGNSALLKAILDLNSQVADLKAQRIRIDHPDGSQASRIGTVGKQ